MLFRKESSIVLSGWRPSFVSEVEFVRSSSPAKGKEIFCLVPEKYAVADKLNPKVLQHTLQRIEQRSHIWRALKEPPQDHYGNPPDTTGLLSLFIPPDYTKENLSARRYDTQKKAFELVSVNPPLIWCMLSGPFPGLRSTSLCPVAREFPSRKPSHTSIHDTNKYTKIRRFPGRRGHSRPYCLEFNFLWEQSPPHHKRL